jgi:hypothetical protein
VYESDPGKVNDLLTHHHLISETPETQSYLCSARTGSILHRLGFEWPAVSSGHVRRMMEHCEEVHFIKRIAAPAAC